MYRHRIALVWHTYGILRVLKGRIGSARLLYALHEGIVQDGYGAHAIMENIESCKIQEQTVRAHWEGRRCSHIKPYGTASLLWPQQNRTGYSIYLRNKESCGCIMLRARDWMRLRYEWHSNFEGSCVIYYIVSVHVIQETSSRLN